MAEQNKGGALTWHMMSPIVAGFLTIVCGSWVVWRDQELGLTPSCCGLLKSNASCPGRTGCSCLHLMVSQQLMPLPGSLELLEITKVADCKSCE